MNKIYSYKEEVNSRINELLNIEFGSFNKHIEAMKYSVSIGGKRIRPCLLLEFASIMGANHKDALDFACAIEFIHTYSLIHDDLPCMDNDDLRRGQPSCHIKFGEDTALLAGDALLTYAFSVASKVNNINAINCIGAMADYAGVCGMIGGQEIDLATENTKADVDTIITMYENKTSRLLQLSAIIGCMLSGCEEKYILSAKEYGKNLGIAFQIIDDILDVTSTSAVLGKPIGSDKNNLKNNLVSVVGIDKARDYAQLYTQKALDSLNIFGKNNKELVLFTKELLLRDF